jgi:arsenite methyltransferase
MQRDCWAEWLARCRSGGDAEDRRRGLEGLTQRRDRILDTSGLSEGERVLDVGCGEGLIGSGALERGAAEIGFSDISDDLLASCRLYSVKPEAPRPT